MNSRLRTVFWSFVGLCLLVAAVAPVFASIVTLRDQIAITVVINVTPAPVVFVSHPSRGSVDEIAISGRLRGTVVAQATAQRAVRVEANVTPNPNATLLYSDQPIVTINATAGTTVAVSCAFHVSIQTAHVNWQLKHGVSNDFAKGFVGGDLANDTYLAVPLPTSTPYVVYADNGGVWQPFQTNSGTKTYCVDLTIKVPVSIAGGAYSTNAVYSLYW